MRSGSMWRSTDERKPWKAIRKEANTVFHHPTCDCDASLIQAKAPCQELNEIQKCKIRFYTQGIYNIVGKAKIIMSVKTAKNFHELSHQGPGEDEAKAKPPMGKRKNRKE